MKKKNVRLGSQQTVAPEDYQFQLLQTKTGRVYQSVPQRGESEGFTWKRVPNFLIQSSLLEIPEGGEAMSVGEIKELLLFLLDLRRSGQALDLEEEALFYKYRFAFPNIWNEFIGVNTL